jgi:hypothetical protein
VDQPKLFSGTTAETLPEILCPRCGKPIPPSQLICLCWKEIQLPDETEDASGWRDKKSCCHSPRSVAQSMPMP